MNEYCDFGIINRNFVVLEEFMNLFERVKEDKLAVSTCIVLGGSIAAKLIQAFILHLMTDYYPVSTENLMITGLGMLPSVMLLVYVLIFYKSEKVQLLLPCTFVVQLLVSLWSAWTDYMMLGRWDANIVFSNLVWIVYYAFLVFATYKGFENGTVLKVAIAVMSLYAMFGSVVTWYTLFRTFPEETVMIVTQAIAIVGYFCYYLATFLIVPKAAEEIYYLPEK